MDYLDLVTSLEKDLDSCQTDFKRFEDYYIGRHPLTYAGDKFRGTFGRLFNGFSDNFCALVVDAVAERMTVQGFRMSADTDAKADTDAWGIWQTNSLDAWSSVAHTEALVKGRSFAMVSPFPDDWPDEAIPLITIEDAAEVIVRCSVTDRSKRIAALKKWKDDDGTWLATLYLPDELVKFQYVTEGWRLGGTSATRQWVKREVPGEAWPLPNPLGIVPIVPLINRPRLRGMGESEILNIIPIQNAINKLATDMLVAAEYGAFRQRWATGVEIPVGSDGKPVDTAQFAINRFISTAVPDAKYGEFGQTDLAPYISAIEMYIQHIASTSRTPPHYLLGQAGTFPSGESLKATETGLVAKARQKHGFIGESWEEVIRLAFKALNDPRGDLVDAETIWKDPESRTEAQHVDALTKLQAIGVPLEQLWEDAGYSPQQIARFKRMRAEEALLQPLPPVAPPVERLTVSEPSPAAPAPATAPDMAMPAGMNVIRDQNGNVTRIVAA